MLAGPKTYESIPETAGTTFGWGLQDIYRPRAPKQLQGIDIVATGCEEYATPSSLEAHVPLSDRNMGGRRSEVHVRLKTSQQGRQLYWGLWR